MNETIKLLLTRRSIRKYKPDPIPEELLNEILQAGIHAPSGGNQQSATVVVTTDAALIRRIEIENAKTIPSKKTDIRPFYHAPALVTILAPKSSPAGHEDGALIAENIMIAAWSCGIGSCWIHRSADVFESETGKALLKEWGLSDELQGICHIVLGYPDCETPPAPPRRANTILRV